MTTTRKPAITRTTAHQPTPSQTAHPPVVRGFEVLERLAFDERRLRQALGALDCRSLEILVRGVDVDPDALRRRLAVHGNRPLTVVVTRLGSGAAAQGTAFICRPSW
jgi:THUMP domain-like